MADFPGALVSDIFFEISFILTDRFPDFSAVFPVLHHGGRDPTGRNNAVREGRPVQCFLQRTVNNSISIAPPALS